MAKTERRPRDSYPTPRAAVAALIPHLTEEDRWFVDPCAGTGEMLNHFADFGYFGQGLDIVPRGPNIRQADALFDVLPPGTRITHPMWERSLLHPLIETLSDGGKSWMLFDADWLHTRQARPLFKRLRKIVSVGRVKWIPNSPTTGKENVCWYCFTKPSNEPAVFIGRE